MECKRGWSVIGSFVLAAAISTVASNPAIAEPKRGLVYNPVTQQMEPEARTHRAALWSPEESSTRAHHEPRKRAGGTQRAKNAQPDFAIEQASYEESQYEGAQYEESKYYDAEYSGDGGYCDDTCIGCGDIACGDCVCCLATHGLGWFVGFEATYVKPHFEDNPAFSVTQSDGATNESIEEVDFNYDLVFNPRVFVGWQNCDGFGAKVTWWQFDHSADSLSDSPPANGFGEIAPPSFGDVDISSNVPTDVFTAGSDLKVYAIDLEGTRQASLGCWNIGVGGGVRYAFAEQHYLAQTRDSGNDLRGEIDYQHSIEGIGPTISLDAHRILTPTLSTFCKARGSVLFGDGESRLEAGEDLDLANSFTTTSTTSRDDVLSIAEVQVGVRWQARPNQYRILIPFFSAAFEGQVWNGAGSATSEDGNLGFLGFNTGFGVGW
jgi:hypothetical protein